MPEIKHIRTRKHKTHQRKRVHFEDENNNDESEEYNPSSMKRKLKSLIDKKLSNNKKIKIDLSGLANPTANVDKDISNTEVELYDPALLNKYKSLTNYTNSSIDNNDTPMNPNFKASQNNYLTDEQKYKLYMSQITDQFGRYYKNIGQFNRPYSNYYGDPANLTTQYQNPFFQNDQGEWVNYNNYINSINNPMNISQNPAAYNTQSYVNNQRWVNTNGQYNEEALEERRKFNESQEENRKLVNKIEQMSEEQKQWFSNRMFKWFQDHKIVSIADGIWWGISVLMIALVGGSLAEAFNFLNWGGAGQVLGYFVIWQTPLMEKLFGFDPVKITQASWLHAASYALWKDGFWHKLYQWFHGDQSPNVFNTAFNMVAGILGFVKNIFTGIWNRLRGNTTPSIDNGTTPATEYGPNYYGNNSTSNTGGVCPVPQNTTTSASQAAPTNTTSAPSTTNTKLGTGIINNQSII